MKRRVFRVGDPVCVREPIFVDRVGYPRTVDSYIHAVHACAGPELDAVYQRLGLNGGDHETVRALAYRLARRDKFGGPTRSLHTRHVPTRAGVWYTVEKIRSVVTGTYKPGYSAGSDEEDSELPNLADRKVHRLATLAILAEEIRTVHLDPAIGKARWMKPSERGIGKDFSRDVWICGPGTDSTMGYPGSGLEDQLLVYSTGQSWFTWTSRNELEPLDQPAEDFLKALDAERRLMSWNSRSGNPAGEL